jgi:hypothetical protein
MVIVRILGGLGNQMFCYAAARRLALVNSVPLKLDIVSGFKRDFHFQRRYLLHQFNIHAEIAEPWKSFDYPGGRIRRFITKRWNKRRPFARRSYIQEEFFFEHFDQRLVELRLDHDVYLEGYWQSENYFKDIEAVIRNDLQIIVGHEQETLREAELIKNQRAVCVGVRRYQDARPEEGFTVLDLNYYYRAIDLMASKVPKAHFFIFSSDHEWVRQEFRTNYPHTFISLKGGDEKAREDLWLMTRCQHFIISNSSFYWWGAWLSQFPGKIVIAPPMGFGNKDVIPGQWIQMPI